MKHVTTRPENEWNPRLSPDGEWLLLTVAGTAAGSHTVLQKIPETGGVPTLLTPTSSSSDAGVWNPLSGLMVYISDRQGSPTIVESLSMEGGSGARFVTSPSIGAVQSLDIRPDGKEVAFSIEVNGRSEINLIDLDGSNLRTFGDGASPAYSPDGQWLCFTRTLGQSVHLFLMRAVDGSQMTQLTDGESANLYPAWASDGRSIAFVSNRVKIDDQPYYHLFVMDRQGRKVQQLTNGKWTVMTPSFGAGHAIYFSAKPGKRDENGNYDIFKLTMKTPARVDG